MELSKTLSRLRKESQLPQVAVAQYLHEKTGKKITKSAISNWEIGVNSPSVEMFLLLCDLYRVEDIRLTFRGADVKWASRLNELGKRRLEEYVALLTANPRFAKPRENEERPRIIRLYDMPVSAGSGAFLDSDSYEELEVDESVPASADYAVRISGDSMTPRFVDRQIVFVKEQPTLAIGDIGIFVLNGDAYCKKLGKGTLLSMNVRYEPIPIHDFDSFTILGRVEG